MRLVNSHIVPRGTFARILLVMSFTWTGLVQVVRAQDRVTIAAVDDRLFYLGPMTALLHGWFDRWCPDQEDATFYAWAEFHGIALQLQAHATTDEWRRAQDEAA